MSWTTIPRWLYENDLPDEQLQEVYIKALRKKLAELEAERAALDAQIMDAQTLLGQATRALARYRRGRRGP